MLQISFSSEIRPVGGSLAILVPQGETRPAVFTELDTALSGALSRAAKAEGFSGKDGTSCVVLAPSAAFERIVLVGLGKAEAVDAFVAEKAGGLASSLLGRAEKAAVATGDLSGALAAHVALGATLGAYHFGLYHGAPEALDNHKLQALSVLSAHAADADSAWPSLQAVARGDRKSTL